MATVKEILQAFCYRTNLPAPTAFVGVNSPTEQQYLSLFTYIGDNLRNRPFQWPQLKRGYYFTTVTGERKVELPGDFYRILERDQWDTTNRWPLIGPLTDYSYDVRQFGIISVQTRKAFRIIGPTSYLYSTAPYAKRSRGIFEIDPAGQNDTDVLFMGYLSCNWIWPRDWVANTAYVLGDIRTGDGEVYICTVAGTSGTTRPSVTSGTVVDGTVTWTVYHEPYVATNDNDLCLFDDDLMIEGLRWAYKRAKGQDYEQERADWENMAKSSFSRFDGPCKISLANNYGEYWNWPNVPEGSWNV